MSSRYWRGHGSGWPRCHSISRWIVALLILSAVVLTGCAPLATMPAATPGIYVTELAAGAPGWIGGPDGAPVWSPNGTAIAWGSEDGVTVWRGDVGGKALTDHPVAGRPAWSPDGRRIAFIDAAAAALVVIDAESGDEEMTTAVSTANPGTTRFPLVSLGGPAWSPDGRRLAFVCWDGTGDEICIVGSDGSARQQVTKLEPPSSTPTASAGNRRATSNVGPASWSPDGSKLAVAAYPERRGAAAGVFVIELAKPSARRVSRLLPSSEIIWAPDGESVVFSATDKGRSDVLRVVVTDATAVNLTERLPGGARYPALAPDGERLAVSSGGEIVVLGQEGVAGEIGLSGLVSTHPAWSPDGEELAFLAALDPIPGYG